MTIPQWTFFVQPKIINLMLKILNTFKHIMIPCQTKTLTA
ncbi:hypothetical protein LCAZH_1935 [Lacticaseibacillus paracasei]|nr:hypothetical protein LCAZH_1935 [Lacticaseibacillus paracasei]